MGAAGVPSLARIQWVGFETIVRREFGRIVPCGLDDADVTELARFGVEMPADVPMSTQERAYTSPIWYTPRG